MCKRLAERFKTIPPPFKNMKDNRKYIRKYRVKMPQGGGGGYRAVLECRHCKKEFEIQFSDYTKGEGKFCSKTCFYEGRVVNRGVEHPQWAGGKTTRHGYVYTHKSVNGNKKNERQYQQVHRAIVEKIVERKLRKDEHVHHINGNKKDNRPENLMIVTGSTHRKLHSGWTLNEQAEWIKPCSGCNRKLTLDKFYKRSSGGVVSKCISCHRKTP